MLEGLFFGMVGECGFKALVRISEAPKLAYKIKAHDFQTLIPNIELGLCIHIKGSKY